MYRGRLPSLSAVVALCRLRWPPTQPGARPPCLRVPRRTTATTRVAAVAASAPPQRWVWGGGLGLNASRSTHRPTLVVNQKYEGDGWAYFPRAERSEQDRGRQLGARAQGGAVENKTHRQLASEGPARGTRRPGATATTGQHRGQSGARRPDSPSTKRQFRDTWREEREGREWGTRWGRDPLRHRGDDREACETGRWGRRPTTGPTTGACQEKDSRRHGTRGEGGGPDWGPRRGCDPSSPKRGHGS